ncbi:hypothetical protein ARMGADRAFT_1034954 [Armillaria gallica]|uniref:Uncharacterized protein n=1 Tax=Armillaria gallica TaxID=47427 RepID=A0A2H3D000_ARMGA|nr:hypothetical protein ARMGADRAFT_1034954 [Armillaria gallica]
MLVAIVAALVLFLAGLLHGNCPFRTSVRIRVAFIGCISALVYGLLIVRCNETEVSSVVHHGTGVNQDAHLGGHGSFADVLQRIDEQAIELYDKAQEDEVWGNLVRARKGNRWSLRIAYLYPSTPQLEHAHPIFATIISELFDVVKQQMNAMKQLDGLLADAGELYSDITMWIVRAEIAVRTDEGSLSQEEHYLQSMLLSTYLPALENRITLAEEAHREIWELSRTTRQLFLTASEAVLALQDNENGLCMICSTLGLGNGRNYGRDRSLQVIGGFQKDLREQWKEMMEIATQLHDLMFALKGCIYIGTDWKDEKAIQHFRSNMDTFRQGMEALGLVVDEAFLSLSESDGHSSGE